MERITLKVPANFEKSSSSFVIKPEFEGLSERLLLTRNASLYEKFCEAVDGMTVEAFAKDNMISRQE
jgi:hypothetical protein